MRLKFLLPSLAIAGGLSIGWWIESTTAARLDAQLEAARFDQRKLRALEAERDRLRQLIPTADHLAALHDANAERNRLLREIEAARPAPKPLALGEWTPATAWQNRGRATARAAIETALWAAAGGDTAALEPLLEIDSATRAEANALLAKLPPSARQAWATPEALIASATTKDIPLTEAQIVWFHEHDADHAGIGMLLNTPNDAAPPAAAAPKGQPPPMLRDNHASKLAMLALHRSKDGWSLVVPRRALARIAQELSATTPEQSPAGPRSQ